MTGRAFADTNVVIYATLQADPSRSELARSTLLATHVISVQVLNEFVSAAIGKLKRPWTEVDAALAYIEKSGFEVVSLTPDIHDRAVEIARRDHFHIYDACIIAAAIEAECDTLWSEDLQAGRRFGRLTVRNPFEGL